MGTDELIFKHPPALDVQLAVTFPNTLEVADDRSRFHNLVRTEFPNIIIPEQAKLKYDFGDYTLHGSDMTDRIEVGMNYFRLASVRYPGFRKFADVFTKTLDTFSQCYGVKTFLLLSLSYQNSLPFEANFNKFSDCFALKIMVPNEANSELFAGQGVIVYEKTEGFVTIQLEPKIEGPAISSYLMNLFFTTRPNMPSLDRKSVVDLAGAAHGYLRQFFVGILREQYIDYLRTR